MGFHERAQAAKANKGGPRCTIGVLIERAEPDYAESLQAALADPYIGPSVIETVLHEDGHDISAGTIGRHRRGQCKCLTS